MLIIHGNIKTMEERDYEDGFIRILDGKIVAIGEMGDCPQDVVERKRFWMPGVIW